MGKPKQIIRYLVYNEDEQLSTFRTLKKALSVCARLRDFYLSKHTDSFFSNGHKSYQSEFILRADGDSMTIPMGRSKRCVIKNRHLNRY